jgi:hypothetical protein
VVKDQSRDRPSSHKASWSEELATAFSALESLLGPPLGSNSRLRRNLARLRAVIQKCGVEDERAFFKHLESVPIEHSGRPNSRRVDVEELGRLSLEQVEDRLRDPSVSKDELLAIVRGRFQGSTGSISRLAKQQIVERIETLVMNERGHGSISRLAQGHSLLEPESAISAPIASDPSDAEDDN